MKETFFVTETYDGFNLVHTVEVGEVVSAKIVSTYPTQELAEDAVPQNSVGSGNIAGASPGDAPIIRKRRRRVMIRRLLNP
jgi:hypothetical protein